MSTAALATQGLDKRFGSLVVASDINLVIPHGVRYALIGPNGAGKTTLINLMTGMLRPDAGQIMLGGEDITVLFIEHDMDLVFRFASRIIVMVGGRILVEGTPQEIAADARVREVYLGGEAP